MTQHVLQSVLYNFMCCLYISPVHLSASLLSQLSRAVSDVTPSDWDKECGIPPPASSTDSADGFCLIGVCVGGGSMHV